MAEPRVVAPGVASRRVALEVLARVEDDGAYANLALSPALDRSRLERADRAFVTDLVYGTIRRRRSLDHLVDRFLTSPPPPAARRALRLGAYQLAFRDDVPDHAAVGATVEASPKRFRPLVNAVLRKVATHPTDPPDEGTRLSYPDWILDRLRRDLGEHEAIAALEAMNEPAAMHVREDGYVQDLGSQLVVDAVGAAPGERVLDLCAAPGGKATGMAGAGALVVAADLQPQRVQLVLENAERIGSGHGAVVALVADAAEPPVRPASMDRVLLDAPCSGLGVLRRRADARWRVQPEDVDRLAALQRRLLDAAVPLVAPGGVLTYSVCTLTAAETLELDRHVAERHPELTPLEAPPAPWRPWGRGALLLPQDAGSDGMFVVRYRVGEPRPADAAGGTIAASSPQTPQPTREAST